MKFYICEHCGNLITMINDSSMPTVCCGDKMKEIIPGSVDAAVEKHVPVVEKNGNDVTVKIGSVPHPMVAEHFIEWVAIETTNAVQIKYLKPETPPIAKFALAQGEEIKNTFAYCNIHGLWKA